MREVKVLFSGNMFILLILDLFGVVRGLSVTFQFSLRNASTAYIQKQAFWILFLIKTLPGQQKPLIVPRTDLQ